MLFAAARVLPRKMLDRDYDEVAARAEARRRAV
jgi:hypothetical protein